MVTIADVAEKAGVSISTVSYAMSGKRTISPATRARVEAAIDALGFRPHAGARSLASRSTHVIGLQAPLRPGVDVHVVMEIVTGVVTQMRTRGYDILLLAGDDAQGLERAAKASMVDALLVMDIESDDPRIAALARLDVPAVMIGLPAGRRNVPCVDFDFEGAGWMAVDRLAQLGHRRIALIGSPEEVMTRHTSYADRLARGFVAACEDAGVVGTVHPCPAGAGAVAAIDAIRAQDPSITGFFIHNEAALPHLVARLTEHDAHAADAPAVVALCPENVARSVPSLTDSIAVPAVAMGAAAADAITDMLAGSRPPGVRLIPPTLTTHAA
ncbi:LacI family DNA-binding transcriptional regulator [Microbacterium sp. JZ31]|uniref:LacI family DNA-binding transcriptional regulator n=1 Tax=Microbacterium sp. JZ31 TaxID=1906274 RepID=UPI00193396A3|nr:LacI family DNA-binding transcriptional regulator [Microbacterium sp. JZ31]